MRIKVTVGDIVLEGELFDTPCAREIFKLLPLEAEAKEWGDEFYFEIPLRWPLDETATKEVKVGDLGYWPPGHALAIFFGPTPLSRSGDPVPASEVNLVGRLKGAEALRAARGQRKIRVEPLDA